MSRASSRVSLCRGRDDAGDSAVAEHGDRLRDLEHLFELVADEDRRLAVGREVADDAEQALRLLGRQHGRGLVEDQDVCAAEQRAQDLDPLQRPDGERGHARGGVDVEAVVLAEAADLAFGSGAIEEPRRPPWLAADRQVLGDGAATGTA